MSDTKTIVIKSKVKATERYNKFLQVTSLFLNSPLTPLEIQILDEFYNSDAGNITTESRKTVRENLKMSTGQLNNYIKQLRAKGTIIKNSLHPLFLQPMPEEPVMSMIINLEVVL